MRNKYKVYGKDLKFTMIYEKIKMRALITPQEKDYFLKEKVNYKNI